MKVLPRVFTSAPYRIFLTCLCILRLPPVSGDDGMSPVVPLLAENDDDQIPTWAQSSVGPTETEYVPCPRGCTCSPLDKEALPSYAVECSGEDITSIDQMELPEKTVHLFLTDTSLEKLSAENFANLTFLNSITLKQNLKLRTVEPGTFNNLNGLTAIVLTHSPLLKEIGPGVFGDLPRLTSLSLDSCGLESAPNLTTLHPNDETLKKLVLSNNKIFALKPHTFSGLSFEVYNLDLSYNDISSVYGKVFEGASIVKLVLSNNPITYIEDNIFEGILDLREVHLAGTRISKLPTLGLKNIIVLDIENTPNLKHFPPLFKFENIQTARLHYFSHCCAFIYNTSANQHMAKMHNIMEPRDNSSCSTTPNPSSEADDIRDSSKPRFSTAHLVEDDFFQDPKSSLSRGSSVNLSSISHFQPPPDSLLTNAPSNMQPSVEEFDPNSGFIDNSGFVDQTIDPNITHKTHGDSCGPIVPKDYSKVNCSPRPDAFNPCSDVMGYSFLRVVVWFIASTAMVGNLIVMVVLIAYKRKMTVPKFLMCNLAFADFCMGIYLLIIASVDVYTLRVYFNHAIDWQFGAGCKIAGFISVFSSELSVFTLTVLTIERWYTIIYAIDLNKRIRLRQAGRILLGGWFFAVIIASLPFFGFAAYGVTSMCLPFYVRTTDGAASVAYVIFILLFNALAFIVICACYIKMYVTVRNPHSAMQRKDSKVAKRMAVLIFTDLACWAPIAINGLSSIFQDQKHGFLTTDQSKVFIVLFYPINSCANPFLYAIFTRAFRRDMFLLLAKHGMCEKRAMKYRPTCTSSPRSMSQVNSTTMRDVNPKGSHRGSSASVMTQITSEARPSMVSYDKDSPDNSPKMNIELQLVVTMGSNSHQNQPTVDMSQNQWDAPPLAPIASNKVGGSKKPNEHVYVVDGLPPVPEELNGDRNEIPSYSPTSKSKQGENQRLCRRQISPRIVEHCITDDNSEDNSRSKESSSLLPQVEWDQESSKETRKNSRADSGIQSVSTTPTDRDVTCKAMQMNLGRSDDFETSL
ncbi:follicle-stimulating hormone receptor-like [Patiria miniata]|uniref:G-protein coupled receptors family 1 profile domain-containing protein n=1 Tax=Patiria miniata TaxID=46514 RepID=A0A914B6V1_PATMI|nr:follicle-stimulating hormone receptor-like [Patiria miniata]